MLKFEINPSYASFSEYIRQIPDRFLEEGIVDYAERNTLKVLEQEGVKMNVKSFKVPHLLNRFVYTNFRLSKARRSFEYANKLVEKRVNTPTPIAYIEEKSGALLNRSFYICVHEEFEGLMREFRHGKLEGREDLLLQFARFTANLHEKQILHVDYSPGNILYKKQGNNYEFYLVDLNRMQFDKPISLNDGCYNLRRLWGNEAMIRLIAQEYAKVRGFDPKESAELTIKFFNEFWVNEIKRHPHDYAYREDE